VNPAGIILYGPPAAGKNTVTLALESLNAGYAHLERLKSGGTSTSGYRPITASRLRELHDRGELLYTNDRYGATYAIDKSQLDALTQSGLTPVIHLGQTAGVASLVRGYRANWIIVCLWCSRSEAIRRLIGRSDTRSTERLEVWDITQAELRQTDPSLFTLALNTEFVNATGAAKVIDTLRQANAGSRPTEES
jgi:guanylate kinase